uniref:30S ribosomal protein S21 n=1 Tax=Rhizophora mucronata TaxID=61149 RepID=A0A2P2QL21_RHIMU
MAAHSLFNFSTFLSSKLTPVRPAAAAHTFLPSSQKLRLSKLPHSGWAPLVATTVTIPTTDVEPTLSFSPFSSCKTATDNHYGDVLPIVCPSLAYANTLHYKSGYFNVQINVEENEPEDRVINRFRRAVVRARILQDCRRRRFFESTQDKKKRKVRDAARRNRKRRPQPRAQGKQEAPKKREDDVDEDDNWDLPEGDIPYC